MRHRKFATHYTPIDDVIQSQVNIGCLVFIADYIPMTASDKNRAYICRMIPRIIDEYWLEYLLHLGLQEMDPITMTTKYAERLPDLTPADGCYNINGTDFQLRFDDNQEAYISHPGADDRLFDVHYLHQLQCAYTLMAGAQLDVTKLKKSLTPYRSKQRDTFYEYEDID